MPVIAGFSLGPVPKLSFASGNSVALCARLHQISNKEAYREPDQLGDEFSALKLLSQEFPIRICGMRKAA